MKTYTIIFMLLTMISCGGNCGIYEITNGSEYLSGKQPDNFWECTFDQSFFGEEKRNFYFYGDGMGKIIGIGPVEFDQNTCEDITIKTLMHNGDVFEMYNLFKIKDENKITFNIMADIEYKVECDLSK